MIWSCWRHRLIVCSETAFPRSGWLRLFVESNGFRDRASVFSLLIAGAAAAVVMERTGSGGSVCVQKCLFCVPHCQEAVSSFSLVLSSLCGIV